MKKFSKNASMLLSCLFINGITSIFIYTYLLAFILDISNNSIINVALFYLVLHVSMIVFSWILAPVFKRFKKSTALKLGVVFKFLFVVSVVLLKESVLKYVYLIAICNALGEVLFWGGANPLQAEIGQNSNLQMFISISKILNTVTHLVIPVIMGYFIDEIGLHAISIAMVVLVTAQIVLSVFIREENNAQNIKLQYGEFLHKSKNEKIPLKKIYFNQFMYGCSTNMSMLVLYYTVLTFGTNLSIGIFSSISSIIAIVILAFYNWKKNIFKNQAISIVSSMLMIGVIVFIILDPNKLSLILFYVVWNVSIIIPETISSATRLGIIKNAGFEKYNIENITISETWLDLGRVLGEVVLLSMGLVGNVVYNVICLIFIVMIVAVYFIHTSFINKENKN